MKIDNSAFSPLTSFWRLDELRLDFCDCRSVIEMVFCGLWSFFYLTTGVDNAVNASRFTSTSALSALAFFAFASSAVYAVDAFHKFKLWRAGQFVQGERSVQQSQSANKNVI